MEVFLDLEMPPGGIVAGAFVEGAGEAPRGTGVRIHWVGNEGRKSIQSRHAPEAERPLGGL
jgi:hypothetical protein